MLSGRESRWRGGCHVPRCACGCLGQGPRRTPGMTQEKSRQNLGQAVAALKSLSKSSMWSCSPSVRPMFGRYCPVLLGRSPDSAGCRFKGPSQFSPVAFPQNQPASQLRGQSRQGPHSGHPIPCSLLGFRPYWPREAPNPFIWQESGCVVNGDLYLRGDTIESCRFRN